MAGELLERAGDLAAIREVVAAARDRGEGGGIIVRAPAGLGKTSLLAAALAGAAPARVLTARGAELERGFAFGVVRQLLARPLAGASAEERVAWLDGPAAATAPLLLGTAGASGDEWALLHGLHWLVAAMAAAAPLVLVCDDLHWADAESLRCLAHLAHRIEELPVAIVGATRPAEPGASQDLLDALAGEPAVRGLALEPLSGEATATLLHQRVAADPAACAAAARATSGNPFLLGELLAALDEAGLAVTADGVAHVCDAAPEGLQHLAVGRLRRLGEDAVALARAVAVLGDGAPVSAVAALAGLEGDALAAAERGLAAVDVLARGVPLSFVHPLLRGAVLADLGPVALGVWRVRAARALAAAGAPDEAVAAQLVEIEPLGEPWAREALERAGHEALARGAPAAAGRLLERALAETRGGPAPVPLLISAGGALVTAGERRGVDHLLAACDALPDDRVRAELVERMGVSLWLSGRVAELVPRCTAALARVDPADTSLVFRLRAQQASSSGFGLLGDLVPAVDAALELAPVVDGALVQERAALSFLALPALIAGASADVVRDLAVRSVGGPGEHQRAIDAGYPMPGSFLTLVMAEAPGPWPEEFARIEEGLRRRGALALGLATSLSWRALCHRLQGALADAELDARTGMALAPAGFSTTYMFGIAALADVLVDTGRAAEALELQPTEPAVPGIHDRLIDLARSRALLALGRADAAVELAEATGAVLTSARAVGVALVPWRSTAGEARLALGDPEVAERLAAAELSLARDFGADAPVGIALRVLGLATGDTALLEDAERALAASPRRLEHARALVDLGAAVRRRGERAAAREPLAAGAEMAARCGATVLLERAHVELRAAGARPRSVLRSGVEALTPSERRVAELARDGLTNREIAQRLFVTQKTVESQLRAVFRKLDIAGRRDIRDVLR